MRSRRRFVSRVTATVRSRTRKDGMTPHRAPKAGLCYRQGVRSRPRPDTRARAAAVGGQESGGRPLVRVTPWPRAGFGGISRAERGGSKKACRRPKKAGSPHPIRVTFSSGTKSGSPLLSGSSFLENDSLSSGSSLLKNIRAAPFFRVARDIRVTPRAACKGHPWDEPVEHWAVSIGMAGKRPEGVHGTIQYSSCPLAPLLLNWTSFHRAR